MLRQCCSLSPSPALCLSLLPSNEIVVLYRCVSSSSFSCCCKLANSIGVLCPSIMCSPAFFLSFFFSSSARRRFIVFFFFSVLSFSSDSINQTAFFFSSSSTSSSSSSSSSPASSVRRDDCVNARVEPCVVEREIDRKSLCLLSNKTRTLIDCLVCPIANENNDVLSSSSSGELRSVTTRVSCQQQVHWAKPLRDDVRVSTIQLRPIIFFWSPCYVDDYFSFQICFLPRSSTNRTRVNWCRAYLVNHRVCAGQYLSPCVMTSTLKREREKELSITNHFRCIRFDRWFSMGLETKGGEEEKVSFKWVQCSCHYKKKRKERWQ